MLDALTFEIIRYAVTAARNEQIKTVERLRTILKEAYVGRDEAIETAIQCIANRQQQISAQ